MTVEAEEVPGLALPPCHVRLRGVARWALCCLPLVLLLELAALRGNWRALRMRTGCHTAVRTAAACAAVAAALALQRAVDVPWNAPGAPTKQPVGSQVADGLVRLATAVAAAYAARVPAYSHALLGSWSPAGLTALAYHGKELLEQQRAVRCEETFRHALAHGVHALFKQRPAALRALHAVLQPRAWWPM